MPIDDWIADNMNTPKGLLICAFQIENQLSGLYLFMISRSPNCEVTECLKLLLQENNNQINLLLNALKDNNDRFDNFDVSEASKENKFDAIPYEDVTNAKIAFQMAIEFENSVLTVYKELQRKATYEAAIQLAQNLVETKEGHIKILVDYMASGIIDKICEQRKMSLLANMAQSKASSS